MTPARTRLRIKAHHEYRRVEPGYAERTKVCAKSGDILRVDVVRREGAETGFVGKVET